MKHPTIVEMPELSVVGYRANFIHLLSPDSTSFEVLGPLWQRILPQAESIPNRSGPEMYGVIYGRLDAERSHPDELKYIAGAAVSEVDELPEGMVARTLPATTFAVFLHLGKIDTIRYTCRHIYGEWLPQSNYQHSGIADIEVYDRRFKPGQDDSVMEYRISVKRKD